METYEPALIAVFDDRLEAERAIRDLEAVGFHDGQIGFALRGSDVNRGGMITDTVGAKDARGAVAGAATGAVVGGVLAAAASILLPGVGPVVAAGILATALGGAVAGTAVGGILGAMIGLGISEEEARFYELKFHSGKAIVAVKPEPRSAQAQEILLAHGGYNIRTQPNSPLQTRGIFSEP